VSTPRDPFRTPDERALRELATLIAAGRQAVLATVEDGAPTTAMVAYVAEPGFAGFLLHLSDLAAHKRQLRAEPRVSLLVCEPDDGAGEVLVRRRVGLDCRSAIVPKGTPEGNEAREWYLARFPGHAMTFDLADFDLVRLAPERGIFNAGFGRAFRIEATHLAEAWSLEETV